MKKFVLVLAVAAVAIGGVAVWNQRRGAEKEAQPGVHYEVAPGFDFKVSVLAENLGQITRIRITPDGKTMLVSTLAEYIHAFRKSAAGEFVRQEQPFFSLKTGLPGFPPEESGLSGMVLGADFESSGDIFLLYSASAGEEVLKNRITRIAFTRQPDGTLVGEHPVQIFEANTDTQPSHQIQGGVGLMIQGQPHLMFLIGEAVDAKNARDPLREAGKVMLIQRDGRLPAGPRPFPAFPKIQAIGLRNAFDLAQNPFDSAGRFALADTGTDRFDRFIYGTFLPRPGAGIRPILLGWDGTNDSLANPLPDLNADGQPDMVLGRWDPTETVNDLAFYPGGTGGIPVSNVQESFVLMSVWGKTGSTDIAPGKKILLGTLSNLDSQPRLELRDFIRRSEAGRGKLGHPLGLAVDPLTKAVYFGDILEGTIYKVESIRAND